MEKIDRVEIGSRIQKRRKQLGFTQEYLADAMDVSVQMISNLERGNKSIKIENLVKLSRVLEVSTDHILTGASGPTDQDARMERIKCLSPRDRRLVELVVEHCAEK